MYLQVLSISCFETEKAEAVCCQAKFPVASLFLLMNASEMLELAAIVSANGPVLVEGPGTLSASSLEQYWTASQSRFERWSRAFKELQAEAQSPGADEACGIATLLAMARRLKQEPAFAVDTEFERERTYWPKLQLIQVAHHQPPEIDAGDDLLGTS